MDMWKCRRCGYVYDPQMGDPDNDVEEGTLFEDLPKTWVCPECGARKAKFEPYEEEEEEYQEEEHEY